ncbi:MAG: nucleoside hydrolase [Coriobacteriia bacterium]|nr:nucleoside hydrolase [Coriobacteriia bacterium]
MSEKIILDADLTMGEPDCDFDDGIALLYLLGLAKSHNPSFELLAFCSSFGNSTQEIVWEASKRVFETLKLDIPRYKGANSPQDTSYSDASKFIVEAAQKYPGEVTLLVTGSTTNLARALELDAKLLHKLKHICFMGGINESLVFNGSIMPELNFSIDYQSTYQVFSAAHKANKTLTVLLANECLPAYFERDEFLSKLPKGGNNDAIYQWCEDWFASLKCAYKLDGAVIWDVVVPAYVLHPEYFELLEKQITLNERLFMAGFLEEAPKGAPACTLEFPRIKDAVRFKQHVYEVLALN